MQLRLFFNTGAMPTARQQSAAEIVLILLSKSCSRLRRCIEYKRQRPWEETFCSFFADDFCLHRLPGHEDIPDADAPHDANISMV